MYRSPSAFVRRPPSPRTASVTRVPAASSGEDHPGRVELHELHVHEAAPGLEREVHAIAVVLVPARRAAPPDARVATGREDDRIGKVDGALAGAQVEGDRAEAGAVHHQQTRDVLPVLDPDPELGCLACHRRLDGTSGVVTGVARPPPAVGAEEALVELPVRGPGELAAPIRQLLDCRRGLTGHDLDRPGIAEEIPLAHGVGEVLLPRVLRIARAERRVDPTRREHGVGVERRALREHAGLDARLRRGDRGAPAGSSGADDEDVGRLRAMHAPRLRYRPWGGSRQDQVEARRRADPWGGSTEGGAAEKAELCREMTRGAGGKPRSSSSGTR